MTTHQQLLKAVADRAYAIAADEPAGTWGRTTPATRRAARKAAS